ncbi:type I restriction endonuclease subunit R [Nostoc sp. PCC 7107]|uniref:type I restriction endonuclease subunit R n=1 Tax=Nostoc sp. PCC 7107 TaxID=317936 RepID=UPI00029EDE0A|nr:type I restriction endonuclease subunit R [Nostoc sp. PCC 7107]AFY41855.1 Restriction endonuclease, type I, EcoRI, R subunit/Type III [Nostoc sp. PCC 7107]
MVQIIAAEKMTLYDLEQRFKLQQTQDESFFSEWQESLPEPTDTEKQRLVRVEAIVANLERRSLLENTVKLAVVAPLLDLSGLFLPPFYVSTEDSVEIAATDEDIVVWGRIDVLVLKEQLWVLVIESKRAEFSLKVVIPQVLSYMLAAPNGNLPRYGLVTNGTDFIFLKLLCQDVPRYGRSRQFILRQDHDLYRVLQILKRLAEIVGQDHLD